MTAIFVDMGDTLVKFVPRMHESIAKAMAEEGLEVNEREVYRALMKHMGKANFPHPDHDGLSQLDFYDILYEMGKPADPQVVKRLSSRNYLSEHFELYEDALPFLREVKAMGFKVILVTNTTRKVHTILKTLDLYRYLDGVIASCDVGVMKPNPKIFYHAIKEAGEEGIHIGDVYEIDYVGARRAYLNAILVDRFGFYPEVKENKVSDLYQALELIKEKLKF
ncbi:MULTISPECIES: HAD family hydrolase [Metallosphaera]|nr:MULTISPECIES: HAD-IA family hydrolase [Metallosphaera]AKV73831.1 2-haloalkanoic acid dehalogenase [Metallosphaera sedula]AKV76072.1 2-haloalkanoic acid dehalogenase [Metallosphaera sedula]AKV78323.1 2-haloalkanoic acid dehalogenase [Metallosphaera sedula]AKV80568.1 2-haloalkanoic acid dehalogenase [Metallosphaera sedula]AKV82816.1 2-haloalkanoic acid dehalogenase [Metallosphaera sedula]